MGDMNHASDSTTATQMEQPTDTKSNTAQAQQNMSGMQNGSINQQTQQNSSSLQQSNNQLSLNQANMILQSKDKLDKSAALINEAMKLMSVDPYAPSQSNSAMNMQPQTSNIPAQPSKGSTSSVADTGNSTTINIYPEGSNSNTQSNSMPQNGTMQGMGSTYDENKMEQLHSGLYKIAVGNALLELLKNELVNQAEYAAGNYQDAVQYYSNQYNLTVQNKNKLNQALTYINEAANLVNINPYISANGLVYDKDRMGKIHQSIQKLAEGVASLNQLSDDFSKQTILLTNIVQNYINKQAELNNQQMINSSMVMSTGLFGGLFDNISMSSVINVIMILFAVGLIFGIFGFIFSLLKTPAQKVTRKEDEVV
jgi:hypothetical protein